MIDIPCVILAGGKSSRMGEDKSLLPFEISSSIIEYQYNRLTKIFTNVYISSKSNKFTTLDTNRLILDNDDISSPMVALKAILNIFDGKVFIIAVDTPFIRYETIHSIINCSSSYDITISSSNDRVHNLCGIFSTALIHKIDNYLKDNIHKINFLVKNSNTKIIDFKDSKQFLNINTKEDYQKALKQL